MANTKSAKKAAKVSRKHELRNKAVRSSVRTYVSRARKGVEAGDNEAAQAVVQEAVSALDRAARKGVIHPNNAARRKSRLMKMLNASIVEPQ